MDPLADLQAWQVERLTGCRVRDLSLYRAAFTHKSALPPELRVEQVGGKVLHGACCWSPLHEQRCCTPAAPALTSDLAATN